MPAGGPGEGGFNRCHPTIRPCRQDQEEESIKLNTKAIQMLINKPAPTGREIFIQFVSDLHLQAPPPPPRPSVPRPPQTHSAPPHLQDIQHQFIPPSYTAPSQHQQYQRSSQEFSSVLGQAHDCLYDSSVVSQFSGLSNLSADSLFLNPCHSNLSTPPGPSLPRSSPSATISRPPPATPAPASPALPPSSYPAVPTTPTAVSSQTTIMPAPGSAVLSCLPSRILAMAGMDIDTPTTTTAPMDTETKTVDSQDSHDTVQVQQL
ncbi:MAG: hypothetical protein GY702_20620 [Desulfobulbaceae bacterium]|nr:hypothetical protein [Desulfobulbaceae bacterium]